MSDQKKKDDNNLETITYSALGLFIIGKFMPYMALKIGLVAILGGCLIKITEILCKGDIEEDGEFSFIRNEDVPKD